MTVSRVVRGAHVVRPDTEARVREAILRLDYRPDPALSALASYRMRGGGRVDGSMLAFLDCDGSRYSQDVLSGVRREAGLMGYGVEVHTMMSGTREQKALSRQLFSRGVRGLLFGPSNEQWHFVGWEWSAFAAVSLAALSHRPAMHTVSADYFETALTACRYLQERGVKSIGFAVEPRLESRTGHRLLGGYMTGIKNQKPHIYTQSPYDPGAFSKWVQKSGVKGLITIHGVVSEAWPFDKSNLLLLNNIDRKYLHELSYLALDPSSIGEEGVRFLHPLLLRHEYGLPAQTRSVALKGTWVIAG